jgi:2-C-methyl-D-erythritol 4-phosphate cytidylyltransferase
MSLPSHSVWTVIVAGGSGQRFGGPKQFRDLGGRPVVDWAIEAAKSVSDGVVLVVPADRVSQAVPNRVTHVVAGGSSRSESVRCGLAAVPDTADVICVHDAARPFASTELFARVVAALVDGVDGAIPGVAVADTIKEVDETGRVVNTPDRAALRAVQTPQAFTARVLRAAHENGAEGTDDAALVESAGGYVVVVDGEPDNRKITTPDDFLWANDKVARS